MKVWVMQGIYESDLFSSVHLTQKGCALACIADVVDYHGIDSDEEAMRVMNNLNPYAETDDDLTEPYHWNHEILKDMTSEQLWEVFRQWCEISYDDFGHRCYNIDAYQLEIQA